MCEHAHFKIKVSLILDCKTEKTVSVANITGDMEKLTINCALAHVKAIPWKAVEEIVPTKFFSLA